MSEIIIFIKKYLKTLFQEENLVTQFHSTRRNIKSLLLTGLNGKEKWSVSIICLSYLNNTFEMQFLSVNNWKRKVWMADLLITSLFKESMTNLTLICRIVTSPSSTDITFLVKTVSLQTQTFFYFSEKMFKCDSATLFTSYLFFVS